MLHLILTTNQWAKYYYLHFKSKSRPQEIICLRPHSQQDQGGNSSVAMWCRSPPSDHSAALPPTLSRSLRSLLHSLRHSPSSERRKQLSWLPGTSSTHPASTSETSVKGDQPAVRSRTCNSLGPSYTSLGGLGPALWQNQCLILFSNAKTLPILLFCSLWVIHIFLLRIPKNRELFKNFIYSQQLLENH